MAITATQYNTPHVVQFASGSHLDSAASPALLTVTLAFSPRYILVLNETTRVQYEWFYGMAATKNIATAAAGTRTLDTNSAIIPIAVTAVTPNGDDATPAAVVESFTFFASGIAQNDQIRWQAMA